MSDEPLVSVIVPVFNGEKYLGRCLRSLLSQNLERSQYEIIVIDDGSTDRSLFAASIFDDEIRIIIKSHNEGLPTALNAGIVEARGEFVVRVDADDYVSENFLLFMSLFVEENDEADAAACDYLVVSDDEQSKVRRNCLSDPIACGIIFRRQHLLDVGLYDEEFLLLEDVEFRTRFLHRYSIARLPVALYRYRRHDSNITNDAEAIESYMIKLRSKHAKS